MAHRAAPIPPDEQERLSALKALAILDTQPEPAFDRISRLAANVINAPIALVSLVDFDRQWFKSRTGIDAEETSRDDALCSWAILSDDIFIIEDTLEDERFRENPLVLGEPFIRFYAGAPLVLECGHRIGTVCVIDRVPRKLTRREAEFLTDMSQIAVDAIYAREARLAGEKERERFELAINASGAWVWDWDIGSDELYCGKDFKRFLGLPEDGQVQPHFDALTSRIHADDRALALKEIDDHLKNDTPYNSEFRLHAAQSEPVWLHARGEVQRRADGSPVRMTGSAENISARKLAESRLAMTIKQLQAFLKDANEYASIAAHDLKGPVTTVTGLIGVMQRRLNDGDVEACQEIMTRAERKLHAMGALVEALLDHGSAGADQSPIERINPWSVVHNLEPLVSRNGFRIRNEIPTSATIQSRLGPISLVFSNLMQNASKHHDLSHGEIVIKGKPVGDRWSFSVHDDGPGVPVSKQAQMFEFRSSFGPNAGTGLGLAATRRAVEQRGGEIRVESDPDRGRGTAIHFDWPAVELNY